MKLNHFKFEVRPWLLRDKHWEFNFKVTVDGQEYHKNKIISLEEINMVESIYDFIFMEAKQCFLQEIKKQSITGE